MPISLVFCQHNKIDRWKERWDDEMVFFLERHNRNGLQLGTLWRRKCFGHSAPVADRNGIQLATQSFCVKVVNVILCKTCRRPARPPSFYFSNPCQKIVEGLFIYEYWAVQNFLPPGTRFDLIIFEPIVLFYNSVLIMKWIACGDKRGDCDRRGLSPETIDGNNGSAHHWYRDNPLMKTAASVDGLMEPRVTNTKTVPHYKRKPLFFLILENSERFCR